MRFTTIAFALGAVSATVVAALPVDFDSDLYARDWEDSDDLYSREQNSKDLVARNQRRPFQPALVPQTFPLTTLAQWPNHPAPAPPPPPPPPPQITTSAAATHNHARSWYDSDLYARRDADTYDFIHTIPIVQVPPETTTTAQASRVTPKARKTHRARGWDDSASQYGRGRGSKGRKVIKKFDPPQPTNSPVPTEYPRT